MGTDKGALAGAPGSEADPAAAPAEHQPDPETLIRMYQSMLEIRSFEDRVFDLFAAGRVPGSTHLGQGQEAVAVGACFAVQPTDLMVCTYRGHAACLAKGMDLRSSMAEILGRVTGCCRGKGGSMHLMDPSVGAMGSFAVVGAGIPVAAGLAWAALIRGTGQVTLSFFGDGATNIGTFHEALNLASIWKLPVVFICENNLYGEYSPLATTTPVSVLAIRAASYGMEGVTIDGNDVGVVYQATQRAVVKARHGGGPTLLECRTYRQKGHSRGDPATYRPSEEVGYWLSRDPIVLLRKHLVEAESLSDAEADEMSAVALARVQEAERVALADPFPAEAEIYADVYREALI